MKLNNKGFALTSMIYMLLVLFLMVMLLLLSNLAQRKLVLDKLKYDVKNKLEQNVVVDSQDLPYQNGTTGIYYETLELAIMKANSGDTIKVLKNVTDVSESIIDENKNITVDLAGYEINLSKRITNNGTLDIYSSVDGGTITSPLNAAITNKGTLTVNGTSNEHTLFINGSSTTRPSTYSIINSYQDAITTINDNVTIKYINKSTSGTGNRYVITNAGTLTINGATIINNMDGLENEYGIANTSTAPDSRIIFNSGNIDSSGIAIYNNGSTKSTIEDPAIKVTGGTIKSSGNYAIYNGKASSMTYITGGEMSSTSTTTIMNVGGKLNITGGRVHAYAGMGINTTGAGNTIVSGGTITKEKNPVTNAWQSGACFQLNNTANATITGNAVVQNEVGNGSNVIHNAGSGTLTIDGNATVENKGAVLVGTNNSYGKIIVNGGTVKSNGGSVIHNTYASSTSTKYGTIEVNGGTVTTTSYIALNNASSYGQIKVTGGTITATTSNASYGTLYNSKPNTKIEITGGKITSGRFCVYVAKGSDNTNTTMTGGELSTTAADAIYNRGNGATVTIGTQGAASNTYPKITGRIWGDGATDGTGLITVNSGTITGTTSQAINSVGDITINGGVISASASFSIYSYNNANATLIINGGTISSSGSSFAVTTTDTVGGTIKINGGTIIKTVSSNHGAVNNKLGTTTITGGTITSAGYGVYATTGSITIGTNDGGVPSQTVPSITGAKYGVVKNSGSLNYYDGKIAGQNGSGSSIYGTVSAPTGYDVVRTLNNTTETATLKPIFVTTGAATVLDASNHGSGTTWTAIAGTNGTVSNATWGTNYLEFNGTNSFVNLGRMDYSEQTVEATISIDATPTATGYFIGNLESGGVGLAVGTNKKIGVLFGTKKADGTSLNYNNFSSTTVLELGKKYHISMTYDGSKIRLYINGQLEVEKTPVSTTVVNTGSSTIMALGGNPSGSNVTAERFKGKMYSAAVYNRALTEQEIHQNAVAGMYIAGESIE
jgi:hypothetical protein